MSSQTPLDTVLAAIAARAEDAAALASDLPFLYAALDRLVEATDIPSAMWATDPMLPRVGESGGVITAVRALQAFPSDGRVVLSCTQLMRHLSRNDSNKERLAVAGCLPVIAATAAAHLPSIKIQENVLSIIGNMSYRSDNRTLIAESGCIGVIVTAMTAHPAIEDINEIGCIALRSLTSWEPAVPIVVAANGLAAVCAALAAFPAVPEHRNEDALTSNLSLLLAAISGSSAGKAVLLQHADTLKAVATLYRTVSSADARRAMDRVFEQVLTSMPMTTDLRTIVSSCNHPRGVIIVMTASATDSDAQLWGCQQLMRIGFDGRFRAAIGGHGGVDVVLAAIAAFQSNAPIVEAACGALWVLAFHPDNRKRMTESGSFLSVLGLAQSKFRGNATIMERCQALYHMLKLA